MTYLPWNLATPALKMSVAGYGTRSADKTGFMGLRTTQARVGILPSLFSVTYSSDQIRHPAIV
jgi:hypothetical protein